MPETPLTEEAALIPLFARDGSVRAYAKVDASDFAWLSQWEWYLGAKRYVCRKASPRSPRPVYMHRVVLGIEDPKLRGDHINGDTLDNRRLNLRVTTHAENQQNRTTLARNNRSGYRGVCWHGTRRKWIANAQLDGKTHWIGSFDTAELANEAVTKWRAEHMPYSASDRNA